jgi:uncharacterized protein YdbL (DUF1318 family)
MENGWGDCGTNVGKARAHQLANKEPISAETVKRMAAFRRHQQNKDVAYSKGCGGLMWMHGVAKVEYRGPKIRLNN